MLTSRTGDSKELSNVTPDKGHKKNLVTSDPLRIYIIHQRETSETHVSKTYYTGSYDSYNDRSHDKESIENHELMDK